MVNHRFQYNRNETEAYMDYAKDGSSNENNFSQIYCIPSFVLDGYEDLTSYFNLQSERLYLPDGDVILCERLMISLYDDNKKLKGFIQVSGTYSDSGSGSVSASGVQEYTPIASSGIFANALYFQIQFNDDGTRDGLIVVK